MLGRAASFLFIKIPLWDPDRFLTLWAPLVGRLFTPLGFVAWLVLIGLGVSAIVGEWGAFVSGAGSVLAPGNLAWLYGAFVGAKLLHELGHGFACKWFGMREGGGAGGSGEVHAMGVMILVLMPVPYVDASSAWALASKWRRIVVGAAGMIMELAVASVAAMVWASASEGGLRAIAYNVIFVAGVSTLLFNANPLLRYDGYYILSDLLEVPNLAQRAKERVYWFVKRWLWGMRGARVVGAQSGHGEAWLLGVYGVASGIYRIVVAWIIIVFVSKQFFALGVLLAVGAVVVMFVVPIGRFLAYLLTSVELARARGRAVLTSFACVAGVLTLVSLVPLPDRVVVEGVVEARERMGVFALADGFVVRVAPDGAVVGEDGLLVESESVELVAERDAARAALRAAEARYALALSEDAAAASIRREEVEALGERLTSIERRLEGLTVDAPLAGVWVCAACDALPGRFVRRGEMIGEMVGAEERWVRAIVGQSVAGAIVAERSPRVEVRVRGREDRTIGGLAGEPSPAGRRELSSAALADVAGGRTATRETDSGRLEAREGLFEIPVEFTDDPGLRVGQRVLVRFTLERKPVGVQVLRAARRVFQGRRSVQ
jgi:putative peptide zinc metalloprotease protein